MKALEGKVALVTGSGRGLGRACALSLAREGALVAVVDLRTPEGEETVEIIREAGGSAMFIQADISSEDEVRTMVETIEDTFGGLDIAINNAVLAMERKPLADISKDEWDRSMAVNLTGVFLCMKYEIAAMLKRGGGAIVNIGSGSEHSSTAGLSWYLGAKQAIYGMTKCAALDYSKNNIRINAVGPGPMWTPALREVAARHPEHVTELESRTPLGRLADPQEVAEAAVWLCSPAASYVLGHTLLAEGGSVLG